MTKVENDEAEDNIHDVAEESVKEDNKKPKRAKNWKSTKKL